MPFDPNCRRRGIFAAHSWVLKQIHEAPPHPSEELNNLNLLALVSCTMRDPILREIPMELSSSYPLVVRSTRHGSVRVSRFLHPLLAFLHLNLVSGFELCLNFPPVPQLFQFWQECSNLLALRVGKDAVYKYVRGALKGGAENIGSGFSPIASFLIEKNETIAFWNFLEFPLIHPLEAPHNWIELSRVVYEGGGGLVDSAIKFAEYGVQNCGKDHILALNHYANLLKRAAMDY